MTKLTRDEAEYARYLIDNYFTGGGAFGMDSQHLVTLTDEELTLTTPEAESAFLETLRDEVAYDRSCGVKDHLKCCPCYQCRKARGAGARLLAKLSVFGKPPKGGACIEVKEIG